MSLETTNNVKTPYLGFTDCFELPSNVYYVIKNEYDA